MECNELANIFQSYANSASQSEEEALSAPPAFSERDFAKLKSSLFWPVLISAVLWCFAWLGPRLLGS